MPQPHALGLEKQDRVLKIAGSMGRDRPGRRLEPRTVDTRPFQRTSGSESVAVITEIENHAMQKIDRQRQIGWLYPASRQFTHLGRAG